LTKIKSKREYRLHIRTFGWPMDKLLH
jgi:hypothetical protein